MKAAFIFIIAGCLVFHLGTQAKNTDSLRNAFSKASNDTARIETAILLSSFEANADSSLSWAQTALSLAVKSKWKKGEARAYDQLANVFLKVSNYPRALEYMFKALEINERRNDYDEMISLLKKIGRLYMREDDFVTGLSYYNRARDLSRQTGKDERSLYFPIGAVYDDMGKADSALMYYQRSYEYVSTQQDKTRLAGVLSHLGALHAKMNNLPLAVTYGRMAVAAFERYNGNEPGSAFRHMADIFKQMNMKDSSIYYAEKNFRHGEKIGSKEMQLEGAELLAGMYEDKLAVKYYRIAKALKDSLYSRDKAARFADLSFNERQRQKEQEQVNLQKTAERKQNIQYAAIAIGLLSFALFYLIFSHSIVAKEKPVRFFGALSLLMVFEFINLILHPYVGELTHHSPLLMLLVMVAIAAMLIPFHHKMEKSMVHRLVEKNKKIRLTAAKRTLASLEQEAVAEKV
jgi:tetratricopeptide (TPR) repeat protein